MMIADRIFDRRHDVRQAGKMEDAVDAGKMRLDAVEIGNVGFDDAQALVAVMLLQIARLAIGEVVDDPNDMPIGEKAVRQVAADETGAAADEAG